ncbi:MAG: restriction endonuclease [Acidimicrobiaceae bacterium]|nr:restriction endonuclease [Acidimicrobiaceae bacterium]
MSTPVEAGGAAASSQPVLDLEHQCREQIRAHVNARFGDAGLVQLVAGALEAAGYQTEIDQRRPTVILARDSRGPRRPRLFVRVAPSTTAVKIPDLQALNDDLKNTKGADQGLLVAWGGIDRLAEDEIRHQFFRFRVWDSDALLDELFRCYDELGEELRARLPLKRVWSLADEPA